MQLMTTDEHLATQAAAGDQAAFEALVRKHSPRLVAFCRHLVGGSDAEDCAQEAFLRVHRHLRSFDPERRFASWLYKIAQNLCMDVMRSRDIPEPLAGPAEYPPLSPGPSDRLEQAVSSLPVKYRAVLYQKYRLNLNAAEIADQMGMSHDHVRVCLHRAIRLLRERLSP
jgi:RNA polymerase sigma-70 factor (ECF subfamily)